MTRGPGRATSDARPSSRRTIRSLLRKVAGELASPYPNLLAVIPDGPDSTAEAALLPLLLATRKKKELESGAMSWAIDTVT